MCVLVTSWLCVYGFVHFYSGLIIIWVFIWFRVSELFSACVMFVFSSLYLPCFTFPCSAFPFCLLSQLCSHACSPPVPTCLSLCLHGYCTSCFILTVSPVFSVLGFASLCLSCLISSLVFAMLLLSWVDLILYVIRRSSSFLQQTPNRVWSYKFGATSTQHKNLSSNSWKQHDSNLDPRFCCSPIKTSNMAASRCVTSPENPSVLFPHPHR